MHSDGAPATLTHSEDGGLSHSAAPLIQPLADVFIPLLAADVGLVNLHDAAQGFDLLTASLAEPLQDEPCGLLRDAYLFGELQAADALARRDEQIHGIQPLVQRDVRPLEYRAGAHSEILFALVATVVTASPLRDALAKAAHGTLAAVRPQARFEVSPRRLLVGEHGEQLVSADGDFVVHFVTFVKTGVARHSYPSAVDAPVIGASRKKLVVTTVSEFT